MTRLTIIPNIGHPLSVLQHPTIQIHFDFVFSIIIIEPHGFHYKAVALTNILVGQVDAVANVGKEGEIPVSLYAIEIDAD